MPNRAAFDEELRELQQQMIKQLAEKNVSDTASAL